jgi:hypothetical protein
MIVIGNLIHSALDLRCGFEIIPLAMLPKVLPLSYVSGIVGHL